MSKITPHFDFEQALEALKAGQDLSGKDGILTALIKQLTEAALEAELERHIETEAAPNRKNGSTPKTVKSTSGSFQLETPRDRNGTFEPQLVKKHQTHLTDEIERKILSLFALGSSYADISGHISELYGIDVSSATINAVTDKLIPELKEWQQRPLSNHYPFVWLDAIHYKVKEDGRYVGKAVYTVLGVNIEGRKEILGLESEGAKFWLSVLTDLNNRGVQDILIAAVDGLTGFPEAINSIFPNTEIQLCIIHQIRNSMKYVASKKGQKGSSLCKGQMCKKGSSLCINNKRNFKKVYCIVQVPIDLTLDFYRTKLSLVNLDAMRIHYVYNQYSQGQDAFIPFC